MFGTNPSGATNSAATQSANEHITAGMRSYNASDYKGAEDEFRKATQADAGSALAYNDLGSALTSQHRWDEAVAAFQKALQLDPAMERAHNNLSDAYSQKAHAAGGTSPEAMQAANEHIRAGMNFYASKDLTAAESEFRKAMQADSASALAVYDLGTIMNDRHRWDDAIAAFRKALELDPSMQSARNNLTYSMAQKAKGGNGKN